MTTREGEAGTEEAGTEEARTEEQAAARREAAPQEQQTAAQPEPAPGSELSSQPRTSGDGDKAAQEPAPLTGSVAAPPDDARQLEREIERTREQLGETVQELIARVDVKSRAMAKATEVSARWKSTIAQRRDQATTRAGSMRSQVAGNTAAARQKAASAGKARKEQLRGQAVAVGKPAWEAMPEQVRQAVTKGASGARQHWMPLAAAGGAVVIGCLAIWQWKTRQPSAENPVAIRSVTVVSAGRPEHPQPRQAADPRGRGCRQSRS
jgi:hypothetical protein